MGDTARAPDDDGGCFYGGCSYGGYRPQPTDGLLLRFYGRNNRFAAINTHARARAPSSFGVRTFVRVYVFFSTFIIATIATTIIHNYNIYHTNTNIAIITTIKCIRHGVLFCTRAAWAEYTDRYGTRATRPPLPPDSSGHPSLLPLQRFFFLSFFSAPIFTNNTNNARRESFISPLYRVFDVYYSRTLNVVH